MLQEVIMTLENAWIELYKTVLNQPDFENSDFESLCVGWCLAKGFTTDQAFDFYRQMIKREYF